MDTKDRQHLKRFWGTDWFLGLAAGVLVLIASQLALIEGFERSAYDLGVRLASRTPGNDVVVVAIDQPSIRELGSLPWARDRHADLLSFLQEAGAKVVGYDLAWTDTKLNPNLESVNELIQFFSSSNLARRAPREIRNLNNAFAKLRNRSVLAADKGLARELEKLDKLYSGSSLRRRLPHEVKHMNELLRRAARTLNMDSNLTDRIQQSGNVVLKMPVTLGGADATAAPLPKFVLRDALLVTGENLPKSRDTQPPVESLGRHAWGIGFSLTASDSPRDGRAIPLIVQHGDHLLPAFSLVVATRFLDAVGRVTIIEETGIGIGDRIIATDEKLRLLSFYYGKQSDRSPFEQYSFKDVVKGNIPAERFRNKLVLVGTVTSNSSTRYATPYNPALPNVLTLAHNVASLLNNHSLSVPAWAKPIEWSSFLIVVLFLSIVLPRLRTGVGMVATLILLNILVDTHFLLLMNKGLWVQLVTPALLLILGQALLIVKRLSLVRGRVQEASDESAENTRMLGLAFQGQGQLDMAFEKFRKCPLNDSLMDVLCNLAADYERKRQYSKAGTVYEYMAKHNPDYKDIEKRKERARQMDETGLLHQSGPSKTTDTILLDVDGVQKPMLGRYQVDSIIGRGAMGVIYKGRDPKIN